MARIDQPGIYPDMSSVDYFADPCPTPSLTQSIAKILIERSPLHAKCEHPRLRDPVIADDDEPEKYVKAQAIGNAAHLMMIRRGKEVEVCDFDSWRTKEAKAKREEAEAAGKTPILMKHFEIASKMVLAARLQLVNCGCEDAFAEGSGRGEVCAAWQEGGFWFRSLIDWLPNDGVIPYDFKTTAMSVAPHGIGRLMVDAGWDIQAAMHERGLALLVPETAARRRFRFVAQEQAPPFALVVCELPDSVMEMGRKKLEYAITSWKICMARGQWPAYPNSIVTPEYPGWAESAWLNREIHEAARERNPVNLMMAG